MLADERPTKRALDAGDSAARFASSSFLRLIIFQLDGFAVRAPAQVTQTVGRFASMSLFSTVQVYNS